MSASITDSELREELKALGVDVGPITDSTRTLYLKKLDKLNAEKRKSRRSVPVARDDKELGNFSSDPDDDYNAAISKSKVNNNNVAKERRQSGRFDAKTDSGDERKSRKSVGGASAANTKRAAASSASSNGSSTAAAGGIIPGLSNVTNGSRVSSRTSISSIPPAVDGIVPGLANTQQNGSRASSSSSTVSVTTSKAKTELLRKKYLGEVEENELSDTDSEKDRKLLNGKTKKSSVRKSISTAAKSKEDGSDSETKVKTLLKSIQTKDVGKDSKSGINSLSGFTRAFPDVPTYGLPSSSTSNSTSKTQPGLTSSSSSSSQKTSTIPFSSSALISGRPALSRARSSMTDLRTTNSSTPPPLPPSVATTTTPENKLILNDTVISDPHNSLQSGCRPRLSMSSIGPRSSTPYNGHAQKIDSLAHRKVLGVNGLAPRETLSDGPTRPQPPPPPQQEKYKTTDEEILSKEFKTSSEGLMSLYSHYISVVIVCLAAGFFILVALAYLNLFSYDSAAVEKPRLRLEDGQSETNKLVHLALDHLRNAALRFNCRQTDHSKVSLTSLIAHLKTTDEKRLKEVFTQLRKWKPKTEDEDDGYNLNLKFLDEAGNEITDGIGKFHSIVAETDYLPIKCRLYQIVSHCAVAAVTVLFLWMIINYYRDRVRKNEEKQKKLFAMVDSILDFLTKQSQSRYSETGELSPTFAISHVRDALIAPVDRLALADCWTRACQFIAKNESRVREETQLIKGEEYLVWRWVADPRAASSPATSPTATPSRSTGSVPAASAASSLAASLVSQAVPSGVTNEDDDDDRPKTTMGVNPVPSDGAVAPTAAATVNQWQGQAFQNVRLNAPPYSLTQCLKIRNMFDPDVQHDPKLKVRVQDAILEKCGPTAHVQHVAINVDKVSREGCVYVKCRDADSAGVAYRALHGWWYDGNLVSVKYLPLKRYHERFPGTAYASTLLQPSGFKLGS